MPSSQGWSIVSHIIPYYFNSWGTGSHLYPANANTLRSGHQAKVLRTLVGRSLWDCLALSFCVLIISQTLRFVKTFLTFLAEGGTRTHIASYSLYRLHHKHQPTNGRTRIERVGLALGRSPSPIEHHLRFVPLLYHNLDGLSSVLGKKVFLFFSHFSLDKFRTV